MDKYKKNIILFYYTIINKKYKYISINYLYY